MQFSTDRFIRDQREIKLLMSGGSFRSPATAPNLRIALEKIYFIRFHHLKREKNVYSFVTHMMFNYKANQKI